ncbi:CAB/ELIP/HLIP superfamily protein [Nostoc carneum NIES-2107]|nr:CAB/ELIP/HLIP superfamily protein [Nostoc carneum NIES-2107]
MRTNASIVDDQGLMNNFAIEPKVYVDEQGDRLFYCPPCYYYCLPMPIN